MHQVFSDDRVGGYFFFPTCEMGVEVYGGGEV